jgi:hypothetical protein
MHTTSSIVISLANDSKSRSKSGFSALYFDIMPCEILLILFVSTREHVGNFTLPSKSPLEFGMFPANDPSWYTLKQKCTKKTTRHKGRAGTTRGGGARWLAAMQILLTDSDYGNQG